MSSAPPPLFSIWYSDSQPARPLACRHPKPVVIGPRQHERERTPEHKRERHRLAEQCE
ncbi:hypothetical protein B0H17DRAFT_1202072 [Mycena rosella]|uniref:Uncharacterized protein n=1 Tax=Mycena rosella TaxID=1033263 RepID=A0AAD7GGI2_MYCRO|nr:hypothetical protein B0H17DRAFT_1202072 [Mycena rosella]